MNVYAESSAVLAWILGEPRAEEVRHALIASKLIVSSHLTLVECERTLVRARTMGQLLEGEVAGRRKLLADASSHWHLLRLGDEILERSRLPFPGEPMRTLDALHLASTLFARSFVRGLVLLSLDRRVRASGAALGFDLLPV